MQRTPPKGRGKPLPLSPTGVPLAPRRTLRERQDLARLEAVRSNLEDIKEAEEASTEDPFQDNSLREVLHRPENQLRGTMPTGSAGLGSQDQADELLATQMQLEQAQDAAKQARIDARDAHDQVQSLQEEKVVLMDIVTAVQRRLDQLQQMVSTLQVTSYGPGGRQDPAAGAAGGAGTAGGAGAIGGAANLPQGTGTIPKASAGAGQVTSGPSPGAGGPAVMGSSAGNTAATPGPGGTGSSRFAGVAMPKMSAPYGTQMLLKSKEPMTLKTTDPADFRIFRRNLLDCQEINLWTDEVACLQLRTSVREAAARSLEHVVFPQGCTLEEALDLYAAVICNPSGSDLAREKFHAARRKSGETIQEWHTRLRTLFLEAFPGESIETNIFIRDAFVMGIRNRLISSRIRSTVDYHKLTYSKLMEMAQSQEATSQLLGRYYPGSGVHGMFLDEESENVPSQPGVHAFGGRCYRCHEIGHTRAECTKVLNGEGRGRGRGGNSRPSNGQPPASQWSNQATNASVSRGNGGGARGNRGRGRGARRGRGRGSYSNGVHQLLPGTGPEEEAEWYEGEAYEGGVEPMEEDDEAQNNQKN